MTNYLVVARKGHKVRKRIFSVKGTSPKKLRSFLLGVSPGVKIKSIKRVR